MAKSVRITIYGEAGTRYSWLEHEDKYDEPGEFEKRWPHGEWNDPSGDFGNSPACSALEGITQSDDCPYFLSRENVTRVTITSSDGTF